MDRKRVLKNHKQPLSPCAPSGQDRFGFLAVDVFDGVLVDVPGVHGLADQPGRRGEVLLSAVELAEVVRSDVAGAAGGGRKESVMLQKIREH